MNLLVVNSEAGLREAEFYGDFIELCPQGWVAVGGEKWYLGAGQKKERRFMGHSLCTRPFTPWEIKVSGVWCLTGALGVK